MQCLTLCLFVSLCWKAPKIKFSVSFNELCGLTIYFLPYDGSECTRVWCCTRESAARERVSTNAGATFCVRTRRGRYILGARPGSNSRDGENEQRAMTLMNTPKRGVITRSMGSTETSDVDTFLQAATEEFRQLTEERE